MFIVLDDPSLKSQFLMVFSTGNSKAEEGGNDETLYRSLS